MNTSCNNENITMKQSLSKGGSVFDFCIIGGGAAGLAAAVAYKDANPHGRVLVVEKLKNPGKKLRATGNGRCNISNTHCSNYKQILEFFYGVGVETVTEDDGRIYPASGAAGDVAKALEQGAKARQVEFLLDTPVISIRKTGEKESGFWINERIAANKVLLACGGKAGPAFGCTGDGYKWARQLGHMVTPVYPVLTAVEANEVTQLKGARLSAVVELLHNGRVVASSKGEIQFTDFGLSGICIMDLSGHIRLARGRSFKNYSIRILPRVSVDLKARRKVYGLLAQDLLLSLLPEKVATYILQKAGIRENIEAQSISSRQLEKVEQLLSGGWEVSVEGVKGWKTAQCSGGGIPYEEVDFDTMESKIQPGLYVAGEILDYQGPCGGYNLNHAWTTAIKAGKAAADV